MAIKPVLRMGHPVLREKAKFLSPEEITSKQTEELLQDMFDTMNAEDGIGIAAPQIGVSKQVAIIGVPSENPRYPELDEDQNENEIEENQEDELNLIIVINPKITILDETLQGFWEGCLSVPGLRGHVERPRKVKIEFTDIHGQEQVVEVEDFMATVFQHELDHLEGVLYVDKISDKTKLSYIEEFSEFVSPPEEFEESD